MMGHSFHAPVLGTHAGKSCCAASSNSCWELKGTPNEDVDHAHRLTSAWQSESAVPGQLCPHAVQDTAVRSQDPPARR